MPIGAETSANAISGGDVVYPASAKGSWIVANDDAETAQSAGDLLSPAAIDDSPFHWVQVGGGATRVLVRARQAVGATVTTSPIIRLVGAYGRPDSSGVMPNDGSVKFVRLDNADWNAAGVPLTLVTSGTGLNSDSAYAYSDVVSLDGYDLKGAWYVGVMVDTAANVNTGTVPIELLFIN